MTEGPDTRRKRICFVATIPFAMKVFMRPHIDVMRLDYDVTLVANGSTEELADLLGCHVSFIPVRIERKISLKKDVFALAKLWSLFRKEKFDCVHSFMPKSGLLAMLAARFAGVPLRFNTFTGQVWATQKGFRRLLLRSLDKVLAMNTTRVLADSHSQRLFLIENNFVKAHEIVVLAGGSFGGVNITRFQYSQKARQRVRSRHSIPRGAIVFLFMGRLNREKGLLDLSRAFAAAAHQDSNLHLLVVGPDEEGLEAEFTALAQRFPGRVHRFGYTDCPEAYMSAADVICLPSYREGFGSVLIEAASVGIPAIASRIYGITDAVEDGITGILHPPTSDREITRAMLLLASDGSLRRRMGDAAREKVIREFSEARVTKAFADFYRDMLSTTGIESK